MASVLLLKLSAVTSLSLTTAMHLFGRGFGLVTQDSDPYLSPHFTVQGTKSLVRCTQLCTKSLGVLCYSVSYNKQQRVCRVYSVFEATDTMVSSPGYNYYKKHPGCAKGYSDDFSRLIDMVHVGHDAYSAIGEESHCLSVCTADPNCLCFDWFPNTCYFQTYTKDNAPINFARTAGWRYYERLCNV